MTEAASRRASSLSSVLVDRRPILKAMLNPKTVAVIGVTEAPDSVGRILMENLHSFSGVVYPIHPKQGSLLGVKAFPSVKAAPTPVDLAVIATPADTVPELGSKRL